MVPVQLPLPEIGAPPPVPKGYTFLGYNPDGSLRVADASGAVSTLPAPTGNPGQVTTGPTGDRMTAASAPSTTPPPPTQIPAKPQGFTLPNGQFIPAFSASDLQFTPGQEFTYGDSNPQTNTQPGQWKVNNAGNYIPGWNGDSNSNYVLSSWNQETGKDDPNILRMMVKTGETEGTVIPFKQVNGQWVPDQTGVKTQAWDTNANNRMRNITLASMAAAGTLGAMNPQWAGVGLEGAAAGSAAPGVAQASPIAMPGGGTTVYNLPNLAGTTVAPGSGVAGAATNYAALGSLPVTAAPAVGGGAPAAGAPAGAPAGGAPAGAAPPTGAGGATSTIGRVGEFVRNNGSWLGPAVTGVIGAATAPSPPSGSGGAGSPSGIEQSYLDLAKEQWLWSKGMDAKFAPLYEQLIKDSMADAAKQRERGDLMWGEYQNTYMPLQRRQASEAANWDNPAEVAKREGIAAATVNRQFDQSQGQLDRALAANNVSASSGRNIGSAVEMANARALGTSAARNTTRDEAVLTGMQLRDNAIRTGMAVGGAGLSRDLAATGSGGAATGTMGSQVNTRNASLSPVFAGLGGGLAANNAGFNQAQTNYQNRTDRHDRNMQYGGAVLGGLMSWLSDENAKEDKQPIDPEVVADILAKNVRVEKWKYKDGRGDGKHHIGPYAQEFAAAFGGDGLTIDPMTAVGIALAANKGNTKKIERLERKLEALA